MSTTLGLVETLAPPEGSLDRPTLVPSSQSPNSGTKLQLQTAAPRPSSSQSPAGPDSPVRAPIRRPVRRLSIVPVRPRAAPARHTIQCSGKFCAGETAARRPGRQRQERRRRSRHQRRVTHSKAAAASAVQNVTSSACGRKRCRRRRSAARPSGVGAASDAPASARQRATPHPKS